MEILISQHAKERYAERIMDKSDKIDINNFINTHADKIQTDISKMIEFGSKIYEGKTHNPQHKADNVAVYLNGTWIVILDAKSNKVITLYTVDLMVGKEFNDIYLDMIKERIAKIKEDIKNNTDKFKNDNKAIEDSINEESVELKRLKSEVNRLTERIEAEKEMISANKASISAEEDKLRDFINDFLKEKVL